MEVERYIILKSIDGSSVRWSLDECGSSNFLRSVIEVFNMNDANQDILNNTFTLEVPFQADLIYYTHMMVTVHKHDIEVFMQTIPKRKWLRLSHFLDFMQMDGWLVDRVRQHIASTMNKMDEQQFLINFGTMERPRDIEKQLHEMRHDLLNLQKKKAKSMYARMKN